MSLLSENSLPPQRDRGIKLSHRQNTAAGVAENGGSVAGSVASYPTVKVKTVIARLKAVSTSSQTVKINAGQTITITSGSLFGSYSNATAFSADDIQIDDYTLFEYVDFYSEELTASEITAYSDGTMWHYQKDAVLWMDGSLRRYDPDNNQHLNASGDGNDLTFGDGTTASTFPTKLSGQKGYSFDGTTDYFDMTAIGTNYAYLMTSDGFEQNNVKYTAIGTAGGFSGNVYGIVVFPSELNPTQVIHLNNYLVESMERGEE